MKILGGKEKGFWSKLQCEIGLYAFENKGNERDSEKTTRGSFDSECDVNNNILICLFPWNSSLKTIVERKLRCKYFFPPNFCRGKIFGWGVFPNGFFWV